MIILFNEILLFLLKGFVTIIVKLVLKNLLEGFKIILDDFKTILDGFQTIFNSSKTILDDSKTIL